MQEVETRRRLWNQQQKELRSVLTSPGEHQKALELFLSQHAALHQVDPARLQRVLDEGAVVEAARGLIDYWSKRTIAGLLLMPPTRHNMAHLYEAWRLKHRRQ